MAATPWPRRAVVAAALLAALALSACAKDGGTAQTPAPTTTGDSALGGAPSPSAGEGGPNASNTTGGTATLYPKDAKTYGFELLKAWSRKDYARVSQLAIQSAVRQVQDSVTAQGVPNSAWTYYACGPDQVAPKDRTTCTYFNANGDQSDITMTNNQLGFATAVTAASLMRTTFPTDYGSYVGAFVGAWGESNYPRMVVYSSSSVVNYFKGRPKITSYTVDPPTSEGGKQYVRISGLGGDLGRSEVVQVDLSRITAGKPNGIIGYKTNP